MAFFAKRKGTNQYCSMEREGENCTLYGVLKIIAITLMIVSSLGSSYGAQCLPKIFMRHWFACQIVFRTGEALICFCGGERWDCDQHLNVGWTPSLCINSLYINRSKHTVYDLGIVSDRDSVSRLYYSRKRWWLTNKNVPHARGSGTPCPAVRCKGS